MNFKPIDQTRIDNIPNGIQINAEFAEQFAASIIEVALEIENQLRSTDLPGNDLPPILAEEDIPVLLEGEWKQNISLNDLPNATGTLQNIKRDLVAWNESIANNQEGYVKAIAKQVPDWIQFAWNYANFINNEASKDKSVVGVVELSEDLIQAYADLM